MLQGFQSWGRTGRKSLLRLQKASRPVVSKKVAASKNTLLQFILDGSHLPSVNACSKPERLCMKSANMSSGLLG